MGGLRKYMPITFWTMWSAPWRWSGTPFFAGFYSKDTIIEAVGESHRWGATLRVLLRDGRRVRDRAVHVPPRCT